MLFQTTPINPYYYLNKLAVVPGQRHGLPNISYPLSTGFLKAFPVSPVVPAVVPVCKCLIHSLPFYWLRSLLPFVFISPTPCKSSTCTACQVSSDSFGIPRQGCLTICCLFPLFLLLLFFLLFLLYPLLVPCPLFLLFLLFSRSFILTYSSVQKLYLLAFVRFF